MIDYTLVLPALRGVPCEALLTDHARDVRATRHWFAQRDDGWTPAQRVRRALVNAGESWSL